MDLNNRHKGETIFVLGCGPNLCCGLPLLKNHITIGMNKILNVFDPTYLLWLDPHAVTKPRESEYLLQHSEAIRICSERAAEDVDDVKTFKEYKPKNHVFLSPDFESGLVHGHSTIFTAINLAYILCGGGAGRIVLLGVDMNDGGHFYPEENIPDKFPCDAAMRAEFRMLARYAAEIGLEILNASPGSSIDDFKKVRLMDVL